MEIKSMSEAVFWFSCKVPSFAFLRVGEVAALMIGRDEEKTRYLVMFKRDFYRNFGNHFPELEGGIGQIMSKKLLYDVADKVHLLAFVMPDGKIYGCPPLLFKNYYEKHATDVPHLIGEIAAPIHFFHRLGFNIREIEKVAYGET